MTRSHSVFAWSLTSLLLACLWLVLQEEIRRAAAQDQPDKSDKPAATSEADTTAPVKSANDTPAADEDPDKAKRDEEYRTKREFELEHALKEQTDAFREKETEEERFQTYAFMIAGAIGILLVGLFVFSRVRKK